MLTRLFSGFFKPATTRFGLTKEELERTDMDYDETEPEFDYERLIVKNGLPVGTSAVIVNDGIIETEVSIGYDQVYCILTVSAKPSFEQDKLNFIKAGHSTSVLIVDNGTDYTVSTAFFIGPSTLVTAGHCVANALIPAAKLRISLPGQSIVETVSLRHGTSPALICSVEASLFKSKRKDIALLKCGYISPNYLEISCNQLKPDSIVDIIGYPGDITTHWLGKHPQIGSIMESKAIADKLLPLNHLTITRGNVVGTNSSVTYTVSTCRGMSGGCVLAGGKAYGTLDVLDSI